jgi:hypothetical protein
MTSPGTAADLLFGPGEDAPEALARQITPTGADANVDRALKHLTPATRRAAVRDAAIAAAGLLDIDLVGLLVAGWRAHHDMIAAARRTVAAPGSSELVDLIEHQITISQQPSVTIDVDGRRVATVELDLTVEFDVAALVADVKGGLLVGVHSGHCDTTATLAIEGTDVLTKHARFELSGVIAVSPGIPLLAAEEYPAVPATARDYHVPAPARDHDVPAPARDHDEPGATAPWWQRVPG